MTTVTKKKASKRKIKSPGVYLDSNGTYYLKFKNVTYRGFKSVEDAEIKKAQLKLNPETINRTSLSSIIIDFLEFEEKRYLSEEISYGTYDKEVAVIRLHILPLLKDVKISDLTPLKLRKYRDNLSEKELSTVYKNYALSTLKSIFRYAQKYHELKSDLSIYIDNFQKTSVEKNKQKERFENIWNQIEFESFSSNIDERDYRVLFRLMFNHGMRVGEVLALMWSKIDYTNKTICIDGSITKKTKKKGFERVSTKTKSSERIIYVGSYVMGELSAIQKSIKGIHGYNENKYIFGFDAPYTLRKVDGKRKSAIKKSELMYATNHDFRHMFVTNAWSSIPTNALSRYIGHKNVSVTLERYSHLSRFDNEKMSAFIDNTEKNFSISSQDSF